MRTLLRQDPPEECCGVVKVGSPRRNERRLLALVQRAADVCFTLRRRGRETVAV